MFCLRTRVREGGKSDKNPPSKCDSPFPSISTKQRQPALSLSMSAENAMRLENTQTNMLIRVSELQKYFPLLLRHKQNSNFPKKKKKNPIRSKMSKQ